LRDERAGRKRKLRGRKNVGEEIAERLAVFSFFSIRPINTSVGTYLLFRCASCVINTTRPARKTRVRGNDFGSRAAARQVRRHRRRRSRAARIVVEKINLFKVLSRINITYLVHKFSGHRARAR